MTTSNTSDEDPQVDGPEEARTLVPRNTTPAGASPLHEPAYLYSAPIREALFADRRRLEDFFYQETTRLRASYLKRGMPALVYASGAGLHELSERCPHSVATAAVYEAFMAEMLIAQGATTQTLTASLGHLETAERHISTATNISEQHRARVLAKIFWLSAIVEKSLGHPDQAHLTLRTATRGRWWEQHADIGDVVAITRQEAMMDRSLAAHLVLAGDARHYRDSRPIEYFRTLKRAFEVVTNDQLVDTAALMRPHVISAYSRVARQLPLISKVSLAKNLAQVNALAGDTMIALSQLATIRTGAVRLGLHGQVRQIDELTKHIESAQLRDALQTFRIA